MTNRELVVASAYTGILMCEFEDLHKYIEEKLGRQVFTHELSEQSVWDEIYKKCKDDFDMFVQRMIK